MKKRLREVGRLAAPFGWVVAGMTGGDHIRLTHKSAGVYYASATSNDWRGARKIAADLRRLARRAVAA